MVDPAPFRLACIVSGGQTGVDRAALDAAIELGIPHGGWCPLGRLAEDGFIPARYALRQTESPLYGVRTERNVLDSDGTLILYRSELSGGTELTAQFCRRHARPWLAIDLERLPPAETACAWFEKQGIGRLNVAGPRESTSPGVGDAALAYLRSVFARATRGRPATLFLE